MNAMHNIAKVTGKAVATAFDLSSFKTACDLGGKERAHRFMFLSNQPFFYLFFLIFFPGCTGAMAYEFTKAHPELSVTVFDLPAVVEMSEQFHPLHTDSRVSFVAGAFVSL